MKKLLFKTILLAAVMGVGTSAWGQTTTLTYDFATWATNGYTSGYSSTYRVDAGYKPYYFTDIKNGDETIMKLNCRFLGTFNGNNWQFSNGALKAVKGSPDFCISQLAIGDKITITFTGSLTFAASKGSSVTGATIYKESDGTQTALSDGAALESGVTYVVKTIEHATLMMTGAYNGGSDPTLISSVVIVPGTDETVSSNPTITLVGVNGTKRTVRIQSGLTGKWYSPMTTYYTTDGSEPTTSTPTKFTGYGYTDVVIESTSTIKALSIATTNSDVTCSVSSEIEAGVAVQLATPTITRTSATSVTITSDQSGVTGSPTATIHYTYGDESDTFEGSKVLTITEDATITAYATATGYTNSDAATPLAVAPYPLIELENASRITYTSGDLDTDQPYIGHQTTYYPLVLDGNQWGNIVYFQPKDSSKGGWNFRGDNTWYNNSAGSAYCWILLKGLHQGDLVIVSILEGAAATYNATYSAKHSYSGNHAYIANADGDVELRFARTSSKGNNIFSGVSAYSGKVFGTIASSGYSSLASSYGLDFANATGLSNAFVVTNITKDAVMLSSVDELPANSGVILKGTGGAAYSIPVKADASFDGTNKLHAAVTAYDCAANEVYILQSGLFHLVTAASTVPAGKAYLLASDVPNEARSLMFAFDDETTGIDAVSSNWLNGDFYNLQGQRVDSPKKGLYIVNGRKVLVK